MISITTAKLYNKSGRNGSPVRLSKSPVTCVAVIVGKCAPSLNAVTENTRCRCAFGRNRQESVTAELRIFRKRRAKAPSRGADVLWRTGTPHGWQADYPHKWAVVGQLIEGLRLRLIFGGCGGQKLTAAGLRPSATPTASSLFLLRRQQCPHQRSRGVSSSTIESSSASLAKGAFLFWGAYQNEGNRCSQHERRS